jgi:1,4-dihydroxy-2-naphthoate octaprenyltransferase
VLIGSALAYAHGKFAFSLVFPVFIGALLLQILANLINDYGDFKRGTDNKERLGPPRAMQMGILTPQAMLTGIFCVLLAISIIGLFLIYKSGLIILLLGAVSLFFSIWYTAGPKPLSYLGFSELAVLIFFGPVPVLGSYYIHHRDFCWEAVLASIGPALLSTALIMTNNLRDIQADRHHNKRTLAVRFGEKFSRHAIIFLILGAGIPPLLLVIIFKFNLFVIISLGALIIPASGFSIILNAPISRIFNIILARIGISLYLYGFLLSIAIVVE